MSTYDYNYGSSVDTSGLVGGIFAGLMAVIGIVIVIALVISILTIIGQWRAFKKAGKGGWEAIIPFYCQVVNCQIVGVSPWWVLIVFLGSFVLNLIPVIGSLASLALSIYFMVILYVSTARSFGKSDGFAAGLYFLGPIFWMILGGKNTQYLGPKPMNDPLMNLVTKKSTTTSSAAQPGQPAQPTAMPGAVDKFCTGCGAKVAASERFCPNCGREVQ